MNAIILYLIKTILGLGILSLVYRLFLLKESNFNMRRWYLLSSAVLSLILPLIPGVYVESQVYLPSYTFDSITAVGNRMGISGSLNYFYSSLLLVLYVLFALFFLFRVLLQIWRLHKEVKFLSPEEIQGYRIYRRPGKKNYSFFRRIFIDSKSTVQEQVLAHEMVHARQLHSADSMFIEILTAVFWLNPFIWWLRNEIRIVHEYQADEGVIRKGFNPASYQLALLESYIGSASLSISNPFNYSCLKNRIAMMNTEKSLNKNNWKLFLLVPLAFALFFAFSCKGKTAEKQAENTEEKTFYVTEVMPEFNGDNPSKTFPQYLAANLKYPEKASREGVSGKVMVQFCIDTDGSIVEATVVQGVSPELDAEALRVVNASSGQWTPGQEGGKNVKVEFTVPINFALH